MARKKITIVGAGHVGATAALWAGIKELGDICLIDIVEGLPQGKMLDMKHSSTVEGFDGDLTGTNSYDDTANSDLVIITAGLPRKPGMSRSDLIETNQGIVKSVMEGLVPKSPDAVYIIVTNPLDVMVHAAWKLSGLPTERVIGMAGALDSARLRAFIAMETEYSVKDIQAMVLGGHADTMVPIKKYCTVSGIPVEQLIGEEKLQAIMDRTKTAGGEIVGLLKTGSAYYAPSAAAIEMAESILKDQKRVIPCAAYCDGQYGLDGVYVGVPCVLGEKGIEKIIEVDLTTEEKSAFDNSVKAIKELVADLKL